MSHSMNGKLDGWLSNTPPKRRIRIVDDDDDESGPPSTADARPHPQVIHIVAEDAKPHTQVIHISEDEDAEKQVSPKGSAGTPPVAQAHIPPPLCNTPVLIGLIRNGSSAATLSRWSSRVPTRHQQKDRSPQTSPLEAFKATLKERGISSTRRWRQEKIKAVRKKTDMRTRSGRRERRRQRRQRR